MVFCEHCGAELEDGAAFCENCGAVNGENSTGGGETRTAQPRTPAPAKTTKGAGTAASNKTISRERRAQARQHDDAASEFFNKRQYPQAIAEYDKAIELYPRNKDYHFSRAMCCEYGGNYEQAIAGYTDALAIDSEDTVSYSCRARTWKSMGNLPKALEDINQAIAVEPAFSIYYIERADLLMETGDYAAAAKDYAAAEKRASRSAVKAIHAKLEEAKRLSGQQG